MELTIGADPEFFVQKRRHFISGHTFKCGTKAHPLRTQHGFVQVDGIALECNVNPATTRDEFISNVRGVVGDLGDIVHRSEPTASIVARPTIFFGRKRLSKLPVENAMLGCTTDYDAYSRRPNPSPDGERPIRTGAGHIHIGWTKNESPQNFTFFNDCARLVRQLDFYLGLPSLLWDRDHRRRQLYGQAGAFRPKPYGLEYRVLSNAWVDTDKLVGWIFDRTVAAVKDSWAGKNLTDEYESLAQYLINENKTEWNKEHPELASALLVP